MKVNLELTKAEYDFLIKILLEEIEKFNKMMSRYGELFTVEDYPIYTIFRKFNEAYNEEKR